MDACVRVSISRVVVECCFLYVGDRVLVVFSPSACVCSSYVCVPP